VNTAPPRTAVTSCRRCADRPATALETVSAGRHDNTLIADQSAGELGGDAHTHTDRNGDMHVVRPSGGTS
jgi:hypothetical protein